LMREALAERLELLNTLLGSSADHPNWIEQRGLTAFWLGVIAQYDESENQDQSAKADFKSQAKHHLDAAIKDFKTAAGMDGTNLDVMYFRAEALRWRAIVSCESISSCSTQTAARERTHFAFEAKQNYARLIDSFERDRRGWEPPRWSNMADLYSSYADA